MQEGEGNEPETRFSDRVEPPPKFATPFRPQTECLEEKIIEKNG